jgi:Protein of unknown function (DUF1279)
MKILLKRYGKIGIISYSAVSLISVTSLTFIFSSGILDFKKYLPSSGLSISQDSQDSQLDSTQTLTSQASQLVEEYLPLLGIVWSFHTLIFPIRLATTIAITRTLVRNASRTGHKTL